MAAQLRFDESPSINLKFKEMEDGGITLTYRIEKGTPLKQLMTRYTDWMCVDIQEYTFFFNGRKITAEDTPDALGMRDGDEIHTLNSHIINVKVHEMDGNKKEHTIGIKRGSPMTEIMTAYCRRTSLNLKDLKFFFNLRNISEEETPEMLGMKDGDRIDVMQFHVRRRRPIS